MKITRIISCLLLSALLVSSCKSTQTITVRATPGTRIYTPEDVHTPVGTVSHSGSLKVKIPVKSYYGYLIAEGPQSSFKVPFGLDYKHTNHTLVQATGIAGSLLGVGMLGGGVAVLGESAGLGAGLAAGGALLSAIGVKALSSNVQDGLQDSMNFSYQKNQRAIQDQPFDTEIRRTDPPRPLTPASLPEKNLRKKATSGTTPGQASGQKASKAKKSRNDFGSAVAGEYIGSGTLRSGKTVEESYENITVRIVRIDRTTVRVSVIENDDDFFESPMDYTVSRQKDGSYLMTMQGIPSAKIILTPNHRLNYTHDKVNIDNSIYTLSITARQQ